MQQKEKVVPTFELPQLSLPGFLHIGAGALPTLRQLPLHDSFAGVSRLSLCRIYGDIHVRQSRCKWPRVFAGGPLEIISTLRIVRLQDTIRISAQLPYSSGVMPTAEPCDFFDPPLTEVVSVSSGILSLAGNTVSKCPITLLIELPDSVQSIYAIGVVGQLTMREPPLRDLDVYGSGVMAINAFGARKCCLRVNGKLEANLDYVTGDAFFRVANGSSHVNIGALSGNFVVSADADVLPGLSSRIVAHSGISKLCVLDMYSASCSVSHYGLIDGPVFATLDAGQAELYEITEMPIYSRRESAEFSYNGYCARSTKPRET